MKHITPQQAFDMLQSRPDALFVDCRSDSEFLLVGHPMVPRTGDEPLRPENICWSDELRAELNPHFVQQVTALAQPAAQRPVVIICRSGRRSVFAGEALEAVGFADVYNVLYGFEGDLDENDHRGKLNGWRHDGLPWEQL